MVIAICIFFILWDMCCMIYQQFIPFYEQIIFHSVDKLYLSNHQVIDIQGVYNYWLLSPGEGNGNPLQYSCLENPMDRGAWQGTVHGVAKSQTRLSDFTMNNTAVSISVQFFCSIFCFNFFENTCFQKSGSVIW